MACMYLLIVTEHDIWKIRGGRNIDVFEVPISKMEKENCKEGGKNNRSTREELDNCKNQNKVNSKIFSKNTIYFLFNSIQITKD